MRALPLVVALCVGVGTASAGVGAGFVVQATRYGDQPNRNLGATLELSLDRGRWQPFTELGVLAFTLGNDAVDGRVGTLWRAGAGTRYTAREVRLSRATFALGFEALISMQHLRFTTGDALTRPELAVGPAWTFETPLLTFRTSLRVFAVPSPGRAVACRGVCTGTDEPTSGFMVVTGVAW